VVIEETYTTQAALHNCMEPHGCTAQWENDHLTLWDSTQSIFDVRQEVAERLKLPEHQVRVIKQYMGGGFGSKQIACGPASSGRTSWTSSTSSAAPATTAGRCTRDLGTIRRTSTRR
jgi:xanthine dehydrogenase molybdopterin-binding subunit B